MTDCQPQPGITFNAYELNSCTYDPIGYNYWAWAGVAFAMTFSNMGTAYGTAKAGMGIASLSVTRPHLAFKSIIPIIMAGILSIYGLIISVLLSQKINVSL